MNLSFSFRSRILGLVLLVAVVPLGTVGIWLAAGTSRSGETLLMERVERVLDASVDEVVSNWVERRSQLLELVEDPALADALRGIGDGNPGTQGPPTQARRRTGSESEESLTDLESLRDRFLMLGPWALALTVYDGADLPRWGLVRDEEGEAAWMDLQDTPSFPAGPTVPYRMTVWEGLSDTSLGSVEVRLGHDAFLPLSSVPPEAAGMVITLFDPVSRWPLRPSSIDPDLLAQEHFFWGGDRWVTRTRILREPPLAVVTASPASPVLGPFEKAGRQGMLVLLLTVLGGLVAAAALARRLTRSLEGLTRSAQALAVGDFSTRIEDPSHDEVGVVAETFNLMADNLQEMLEKLSQKESLAAVGEFAASLAHEVRNPLTAIRVDLQKVLAGLPPASEFRPRLQRSLAEVDHLNATIEETLRQARIGRPGVESVNLLDVLRFAADAARPFFAERKANLTIEPQGSELFLTGDTETLRQAFLNLIRNAAESLGPGGTAVVCVGERRDEVEVTVADTGSGIPLELQDRIFEPLFTTRSNGTGLGLTIVKRIVEAHGGSIRVDSEPGRGTRVHVRFPKM